MVGIKIHCLRLGFRGLSVTSLALGVLLGCGSPASQESSTAPGRLTITPRIFFRAPVRCKKPVGPRGFWSVFQSVSAPTVRPLSSKSAPRVGRHLLSSGSTSDVDVSLGSTGWHIKSVTQIAAGPQIIQSHIVDRLNWSFSTTGGTEIPNGTTFSIHYEPDEASASDASATVAPEPGAGAVPSFEDASTPPADFAEDSVHYTAGSEEHDEQVRSDLHVHHVASEANIVGQETCIEFKVPPDPHSLFDVESTTGRKASARYVEGRKVPWCILFDEGGAVAPGDEFSIEIYLPTEESCGQPDNNSK